MSDLLGDATSRALKTTGDLAAFLMGAGGAYLLDATLDVFPHVEPTISGAVLAALLLGVKKAGDESVALLARRSRDKRELEDLHRISSHYVRLLDELIASERVENPVTLMELFETRHWLAEFSLRTHVDQGAREEWEGVVAAARHVLSSGQGASAAGFLEVDIRAKRGRKDAAKDREDWRR